MFLYLKNVFWKYLTKSARDPERIDFISHQKRIRSKNNRKELLSPQLIKYLQLTDIRTLFFASFHRTIKAALTIEAAMVLPLFLFCMTAVLQYANAMECAVRFGSALTETGKHMAVAAYMTKYGGDVSAAGEFAIGALSTVYAQNKVVKQAGDLSAVKNENMLLSSFLQKDDMVDLVLTYQIRSPISVIRLPDRFFVQRAKVRAWTGRKTASDQKDKPDEGTNSGDYVYVTATGSVYHEDPECTHLKLSVRTVDKTSLDHARNKNGEIYHACEKCGDKAGDTVFITNEGNRYHSSLSCSGLKRTVKQVTKEEVSQMRACKKCGQHE